jgi:hypothetical protein
MKLKKFSKLRLSVPSAPKKQVVKVVTTFFVNDDVVDVDVDAFDVDDDVADVEVVDVDVDVDDVDDDVADVEVVDVDVADVEAFRTRLARGPPAS